MCPEAGISCVSVAIKRSRLSALVEETSRSAKLADYKVGSPRTAVRVQALALLPHTLGLEGNLHVTFVAFSYFVVLRSAFPILVWV